PTGLWDRYEILELLGEGGMGSVHRAHDRRLGRMVAIKLLRRSDPNMMMRFMREATTLAKLDHPRICRIYDVGEIEGRPYLAIKYLDGEPLNKAAAQMSLEDKLAAIRDTALALHEAHRRGIVHRDIKPANIMIERAPDGRCNPIVMDFGVAREAAFDA